MLVVAAIEKANHMVDFKRALELGMSAADAANKNTKEIDAVFHDLNAQLFAGMGGKVNMQRMPNAATELMPALRLSGPQTPAQDNYSLAVESTVPERANTKIASWTMDAAGYPCSIELGNKEWICIDKDGLEKAFSELLQQPTVAEAIRRHLKKIQS
jgi:hypothetical protein